MVANAYARTYHTQSVLTASPGQLVLMLFDGALRFLALAKQGFVIREDDPRRIEVIHKNLMKVQAILDELQATLDKEQGGDFAATMDRLYDYHRRLVLEANLKKQAEPLEQVEYFLQEIRSAWAEMLRKEEGARLEGVTQG